MVKKRNFGAELYLLTARAGRLSLQVHPKLHLATAINKRNLLNKMVRK
jgi:mannose-6-phosphate isomerase class I